MRGVCEISLWNASFGGIDSYSLEGEGDAQVGPEAECKVTNEKRKMGEGEDAQDRVGISDRCVRLITCAGDGARHVALDVARGKRDLER
jgi:hypothetical protein